MSDTRIRLGGLWKNRSESGAEYLSGKFGMARPLIFKNDRQPNDGAPDCTMYLVPDEDREGAAAAPPTSPSHPISDASF